MVHAVVSAPHPRPAVGGAAGAAQLVCRGGALRVAPGGGAARGAAAARAGDAPDRGQPLREGQQAPLRHGRRAAGGGLQPAGAERRPGGARGLRAPGGRRERARADGGLQLQPAAAALQRGRQGVPGGHRRRMPGGRTGPAHLPAQGDRDNRAALAVGSPGGAPLRLGADIRRVHVAKPIPWQRAP